MGPGYCLRPVEARYSVLGGPHMLSLAIAASALCLAPVDLEPPVPCMTIAAGYHSLPPEIIEAHLDAYEAMGMEMLRVETTDDWEAFMPHLHDRPFRLKLILYVLGLPPDYAEAHAHEAMTDQHGARDWHFGPWHSDLDTILPDLARKQMDRIEELGVLPLIDEIVADLGPAGEGIYPANWTLAREGVEEGFWCYGEAAQADFRRSMEARYATLRQANAAWDTAFEAWDEVAIPPPGTDWAKGRFWRDMLEWYRDAKRDFMSLRIDQTLEIAREYLGEDAEVVVYLPGWAYSESEWEEAVATASGAMSIRLMMDNDWLMARALERGCVLQYTGSENAGEVARILRKLRLMGHADPTILWGENAGVAPAGRNPRWLAEVVTHYGLRGLDYTWDSWLWAPDAVTPSDTYPEFVEAAGHLRAAPPGPQDTPLHLAGPPRLRQPEPGVYELEPIADTRLLSLYPDTVKGFGPELAAVAGWQEQHALLRFPIEGLPGDAAIESAALVLTGVGSYGDSEPIAVEVRAVTAPWEESGASWLARSVHRDWEDAGGQAGPVSTSAEVTATEAGSVWRWDVTDLVDAWGAGRLPNHGLMLALPDGADGIKSFASREHPDAGVRPVLRCRLNAP
ncbi:MAG: DNRLRE domain-containing protein, partial [Armatimonadia bacterium]|nr:DNRLRE domain-containing protein [Armatimonadia bacterium]